MISNARSKMIRALARKKIREQEKHFAVEGVKMVHELLTNTDLEEDNPAPAKKGQIDLPFDRPFVFCYGDEGGEDESTE